MRHSATILVVLANAATASCWTKCVFNALLTMAVATTTNTNAPNRCRQYAVTSASWRRRTTTSSAKLTLPRKAACPIRSSTSGAWFGKKTRAWLSWRQKKLSERKRNVKSIGPIRDSSRNGGMQKWRVSLRRQPTITRCANCCSLGVVAKNAKSSNIISWCGRTMVYPLTQAVCSTSCKMLMLDKNSWWAKVSIQ